MINSKVMIFTKNSPWGVVKHPTKGNIYKHVINFPTGKKDEFVNEYLCQEGKTIDEEFSDISTDHGIEWIDEKSFRFWTSLKQQNNRFDSIEKLVMSDIAVTYSKTKDSNGKYIYDSNSKFYWALKVIQRTENKVLFEAELDIFFTYDLKPEMFFNTYNYVVQGHVNRYTKDGKVNWDAVLKNKLDFEPTIEQNIKLDKKKLEEVDYWALIYIKNTAPEKDLAKRSVAENWMKKMFKGKGIRSFVFNTTLDSSTPLPYNIYFIPFSMKKSIFIGDSKEDTKTLLKRIILKTLPSEIFSIRIQKNICISNDAFKVVIDSNDNYRIYVDQWRGIKLAPLKSLDIQGGTIPSNIFYIQSLNRIRPGEIGYSLQDLKDFNIEDPIELHPSARKFKLWSWKGKEIVYPWHKIFTDNELNKIKCLNFFAPETSGGIIWIEPNSKYQENKITNTSYMNIENETNIPVKGNLVEEFFRDNKNQWETRKNYDKQEMIATTSTGSIGIASSIFGGVASLLSGNLVGAAAGFFGAAQSGTSVAQSQISYNRKNAMRKAHVTDLSNQIPEFQIGNSFHSDLFISNYAEDLHDLRFSMFSLRNDIRETLRDQVKNFGYEINENKKIKDMLNTRNTFNYIEASDIFNVIKKRFSPPIKQIISGAFQQGVTIWHYKDKETWKGILNYESSNDEISGINKITLVNKEEIEKEKLLSLKEISQKVWEDNRQVFEAYKQDPCYKQTFRYQIDKLITKEKPRNELYICNVLFSLGLESTCWGYASILILQDVENWSDLTRLPEDGTATDLQIYKRRQYIHTWILKEINQIASFGMIKDKWLLYLRDDKDGIKTQITNDKRYATEIACKDSKGD